MKSFLGILFNALSYRVSKELKTSLFKNETFLKNRWSLLEKSIVQWSIYYKKYIILIIVLFTLVFCALLIWRPIVKSLGFAYPQNWRQLLDWQTGFLTGQLTIVGVVYPLVVGLISILFQNKSAKKTIFPIYQKYSGFMFAGISGLTLSCFIILGYFLRAYFIDSTYFAYCITSALWLALNILLTTWFFIQTFKMLDDSFLDELVRRFSLNESCQFDIRERLKQLFMESAVDNHILFFPDENVLDVMTFSYSDKNYKEVTREVSRGKSTCDIWYGLINLALVIQTKLLKIRNIKDCSIIIMPYRKHHDEVDYVLAKYSGFEINIFVKLLIRIAFFFKLKKLKSESGLSEMLNGIIGSANDTLREGNVKGFSDAVNSISDWHTELALALSFKTEEDKMDNWLHLPLSSWGGRTYLDEFMREYFLLARSTVERIPEDSSFYNDMLHLHKKIFNKRRTLEKKEIRSLILGSYYLWYLLIEWRSFSSKSGDMRVATKYEDILYDFVGAWEYWIESIERRVHRSHNIDEKSLYALVTHLGFTAQTAISALRFNNYEATGWGVDMLNNWYKKLMRRPYSNVEYSWRSVLLNHYYLLKDPSDSEWQIILNGKEFDSKVAINIAFKHANLDIRIITACYILLKPIHEEKDLLINYVNALLSGAQIHQTRALGRSQNSISSAGEFLGCYFRHRDYHNNGENSYGNWLSSILESFGRVFEERRVSGRIYTGWGARSSKKMEKAYVEIGISLSKKKWTLPRKWEEAIQSEAFSYLDRNTIISDLQAWKDVAQEDRSYILFEEDVHEELIGNFCASIDSIIKNIEDSQNNSVGIANVDTSRLREISLLCSEVFDNSNSSRYPLDLFDNIEHVDVMDDTFLKTVPISDFPKEDIAQDIETVGAINENEFFSSLISNNVKFNFLSKLVQYPNTNTYCYYNMDEALSEIGRQANATNYPILFVGNQALVNIFRRATYDRVFADKYNISQRDGFDDDYICHIWYCEVYDSLLDFGDFCILTTKELFKGVSFKQISEGQFVETRFIENPNNNRIGTLKHEYWMDIELRQNKRCLKIELEIENEGDENI